ncbi:HD domain-containing protein [Metaclostridioides mangenotii]|uniref:HD domain-containing protein n=1 Tax=Metaclostridioides mangenotii TaxID=1540 RepID=UPI0004854DBF|nr:HD domain-containing protein [Clostridioides mangenotii]
MRERAVEILNNHLSTDHLVKHSYAVESVMRALAERLEPDRVEEWAIAGLLHDLDSDTLKCYEDQEDMKKHGVEAVNILEKENFGNDYIYHAIKAHNEENGTERLNTIDKAIYAADPITGFITAITLVYPDKKLSSVKVKSITKRMKEKRFAAGANRDAMNSIEEVGIEFPEFAELALEAMRGISNKLEL